MTEHVPVVIIGGGIGGLTLGALLRRLDIPFVILERAPVVTPQGAGISLAPNCLRVLEQLGLLQAIQVNSQELLGIRVYREKDCWGTINFGLAKRWFGYNVHSIERHEFHRYLYEAAGGAETVRFGWNVVDIVDGENARAPVRVVSDDGRTIYADVVAGADGIRSATRRIVCSLLYSARHLLTDAACWFFGPQSREYDSLHGTSSHVGIHPTVRTSDFRRSRNGPLDVV
ncbi:FAD-dependent oxidoreductase [Aspergillus melleus]|uniref:FAD-dependent oxidoreductase n=1 Tax=Aspergillus melleus TaxID=138277 RepID=UPI001E8E0E0D|nr:uncharacterized protein LDX57_012711 [Aspergillus melleus]KAH8435082.1 hypothetical protein LDX57_012711 [Aspergillus melleus]